MRFPGPIGSCHYWCGLLVAFTVHLAVPFSAVAEVVIPSGIETFHRGDSDSPGVGSNSRVIDGSGMSKPDAAAPLTWTATSTDWMDDWQGFEAPGGANRTWAVLDLGAATPDLDMMWLWNVNEGGVTNRGMNSFEIYHATSPLVTPPATSGLVQAYDFASGGWTQIGGTHVLPVGSGAGQAGTSFAIGAAGGARFIGIKILTNHGGNRVGFAEVAFTTAAPTGAPTVETLAAANLTSNAARIRGGLTDLGTSTPSVKLYWGTSDGGAGVGGWTGLEDLGSRAATGEFFSDLGGLAPNTTYFFRAFGSNVQGDAWASTSESFTTLAAPPVVGNLAPSGLGAFTATLGGEVSSTGGEDPTMTIYYGSADGGTDPGAWGAAVDLGTQSGAASSQVTGLTPGTGYYFRAQATNSGGAAWASASGTFTTSALGVVTVINSAATGITGISAVMNGEVTGTGGDPPAVTLYYGTTDGGGDKLLWDGALGLGTRTGTFSAQIANLLPETSYFFRALATNAAGEVWASPSLGFVTPAYTPPSVVINEIHYDEDDKTVRAEFIELHNPSGSPVDLGGFYFSDGIDYTFPVGTSLPAGGFVLVAEDPAVMESKFGVAGAFGPFANGTKLKNSGETVTLCDPAGTTIDQVDYQLGFPWPTVGDDLGSPAASPSIELINPQLDNDLGGSWRAAGFPVANPGGGSDGPATLVSAGQAGWRYRKGTSYPAVDGGGNEWWDSDYDDSADGAWLDGTAVIGYGDGDDATVLTDMEGGYISIFLRKEFTIAPGGVFDALTLRCYHDDGAVVYLNGVEIGRFSVDAGAVPFPPPAGFANDHEASWSEAVINGASAYLVEGTNVLAIHCINGTLASSDLSIDAEVIANPDGGGGGNAPTPGAPNASSASNAPPQIRQVGHTPVGRIPGRDKTILSGESVLVTAKVSDPAGVASVALSYQIVDPGDYFCRYNKFNSDGTPNDNPRYEEAAEWTTLAMSDDGTGGDAWPGDSVFSVTLSPALQTNRRLIRYRITAADLAGSTITVPYRDDPQPNFAYYVYDGTPDWSGVIRPGDTAVNHPGSLMSSIPTYFLLSTNTWVDDSQFGGYRGAEYLWPGTLVYDGKVYDHIQYRPRGGGHRFDYGKNFWKFDFGRGHRFQARDRNGKEYDTKWNKLNFSSIVQQVGFNHRGEQGLFEGVGFRMFELCGVDAPKTHYTQFYVVDQASPTGADQYEGDYYGLFLAIEQMNGQFLDEHGLPDGNLYKIEGSVGDSNNQGPDQVSDGSDVSAFISAYRNGTPDAQWWSDNLDVGKYLSYRTVVEGIHHYDIAYGKNYFYYNNPETGKFEILPWDVDLCWANNMYGSGNHDFKSKVANNPAFVTDYRNRVREIMDLLYNSGEGHRLIDEMVRDVWTPGAPSLVGADRRLWDNNPRLNAQDRYYDIASNNDFGGMIQILKSYIGSRGSWMTTNLLTDEADIPDRPTITFTGTVGFPTDDLSLASADYNSPAGSAFAAMEWRLAEVYNPTVAGYVADGPDIYEIENPTESGELVGFESGYRFPPLAARVGHTYRARVRHKDASGRWSHWSAPLEFVAGIPDVSFYRASLVISEIMYNPPGGSQLEFLELRNIGDSTVDLTGLRFTKGVDFDFPDGMTIAVGASLLVVSDLAAFEAWYGTGLPIAGVWEAGDKLNNGGENLKLSFGAGVAIHEFVYDDLPDWPTSPDGAGPSLVLIAPETAPPHGDPFSWRPSVTDGGTPGGSDAVDFVGDPNLDADRDGLPAFLEHALGTSDDSAGSFATLAVGKAIFDDGTGTLREYLTISSPRNLAADDVIYEIQTSTTLEAGDWAGGPGFTELVSMTDNGNGTATMTWRSTTPIGDLAREFIRLKVRRR